MELTPASVDAFLDENVSDERVREDSNRLIELMAQATGEPAVLWSAGIIGFGRYHYRYESGHCGDAPLIGFSPRKREMSLYFTTEPEVLDELLPRLGPHRAGKSCVYVKRLEPLDSDVLLELIQRTVAFTRAQHTDAV